MSQQPAPTNNPISSPKKGKKLLDQLSDTIRAKHYSYRTEETYIAWVRRYTLRVFHKKRHPKDMGVEEIQAFISHLATERRLSASSQNPCTEPVEVRPSAPSPSSSSTDIRHTLSSSKGLENHYDLYLHPERSRRARSPARRPRRQIPLDS